MSMEGANDPSVSDYGTKVKAILDLHKKNGVVEKDNILDLVNIKEIALTADKCMSHLRIHEGDDADKLGLYLPEVNHHKLQLNEEKYKKMRSVIKNGLEKNCFQKKIHVVAFSMNNEKKGVPFYYQGKLHDFELYKSKRHKEEETMYGEFIFDKEHDDPCDVYSPLDGLHREFAICDIVASEGRDACKVMLESPMFLSIYYPATDKPLNNDESANFASMMRIFSKIISEELNMSLNSTLCDAVASVGSIDGFKYVSEFLLEEKDMEGQATQFVKLKYQDLKKQFNKCSHFQETVVKIFKELVKSEDFLILFKSKWKANFKKDSDFKKDFWKAEHGFFANNPNLKLFFLTNYDLGGHNFKKHITNDTPNYSVEDKKKHLGIEFACYAVARSIEPLFWSWYYRTNVLNCIDRLTTSGLITITRLHFMSTVAFEISNMIVEEFYRYSDFTSGNEKKKDLVLKKESQKVTSDTKSRNQIVRRILFNFIMNEMWNGYYCWKKIFQMDERQLKRLEQRFRDTNDTLILENVSDVRRDYNIGVDMIDLMNPDNPKFDEKEKLDHLRNKVMDLFVLRYVDYLRAMLSGVSTRYPVTVPLYQFCISSGVTLAEKHLSLNHIPHRVHWFELIDNCEKMWDVFRTHPEKTFEFTDDEKNDIPRSRFKRFVRYIEERFGLVKYSFTSEWLSWTQDITTEENVQHRMHISLDPYCFLDYLTRVPINKVRAFDPLKLYNFLQMDHQQSLSQNPTETLTKYKIPLNEKGVINEKWAEYLEELQGLYKPEIEDEDVVEMSDMAWDTLHNKIMNRYRRSRDKDTFVSGIINFGITRLVKAPLRMKLSKEGKWKPPRDHATSKTIEVPRKEADTMLQFLNPTKPLPPFIGNNFFCSQKAVSKNDTVQYQKLSPKKPRHEDSTQFEEDSVIESEDDDSSYHNQDEKDSNSASDDVEIDDNSDSNLKSTPKKQKRKSTNGKSPVSKKKTKK